MLHLITDIPFYRAQRYPTHAQIVTWDVDGKHVLDSPSFIELINRLQAAMEQEELGRGDRVCVLSGGGDAHLLAAEFACMRLGCTIVPLHDALPISDMQMILSEVKPVCTIAKSTEGSVALGQYKDTGKVITLDVLHTPPFATEEIPDALCRPEDIALIIYTSGSTGGPKGVMLSHDNVISTVMSALAVIPVHVGHTVLSYLPVSHILERIAIYCYLTAGVHLHLADTPRQGMTLLKKIRPQYMTAVPRVLDRAVQKFQKAGDEKHYFLRSILLWALEVETGRKQFLRALARKIILRRLRSSFGNRIKGILVGGASLSPFTERIFRAAGIKIREGYGLTECCGVAALNRFEPGGNKPGTVGMPAPGVEIKLIPSPGIGTGEILVRSRGIMRGYFKKPEETATVLTADGWLKTGDRGEYVDERFLRITGRVKEQFKNAFGEYVSPLKLEQLLEQDPWINRAMIIGSGRSATGALIIPDFEVLEEWCQIHKVHWTAPMYMVHNTQILQEFEKHLVQVNKTLSAHEQMQKFRLIAEAWTVENGLLTPSLKLRRDVIEERYKKIIDEMYSA